MVSEDRTLNLIASLYHEQVAIDTIIADMRDGAELEAQEIAHELRRSFQRRGSLSETQGRILLAGVSR